MSVLCAVSIEVEGRRYSLFNSFNYYPHYCYNGRKQGKKIFSNVYLQMWSLFSKNYASPPPSVVQLVMMMFASTGEKCNLDGKNLVVFLQVPHHMHTLDYCH